MQQCTIVMYHYVRPLGGSRIKGLDTALFDGQLDYLQRHYNMIATEQLLDAMDGGPPLPPRSALLSFDDGMIDHYAHAFPRLKARGLTGAFFPPATAVLDRVMLDVHKVHHILASSADIEELASFIDRTCEARQSEYGLESVAQYRALHAAPTRYDPAMVVYVKRMLQHALPEALRIELAANLFARYVSSDERAFADNFYVSVPQLREMHAGGMHIGSHGDKHYWLSRLDEAGQRSEVGNSLRLLQAVGCDKSRYTICYPYGDYDARTVEIARAEGFRAGFTTEVGLAQVSDAGRFALARLDTNDLPKRDAADPADWTLRAG
jgi:peptidoglycan/xylan/chitin deacetylase (PgdA/CDA1 family)